MRRQRKDTSLRLYDWLTAKQQTQNGKYSSENGNLKLQGLWTRAQCVPYLLPKLRRKWSGDSLSEVAVISSAEGVLLSIQLSPQAQVTHLPLAHNILPILALHTDMCGMYTEVN